MLSINQLICQFNSPEPLDRYDAALKLIGMGNAAYPALLEAVDSDNKQISEFSLFTLAWTEDASLLPKIFSRIRKDPSFSIHPLYRLCLAMGQNLASRAIPYLTKTNLVDKMIFLLQDLLGETAQKEKGNLDFLLEFESFLSNLHHLMALSHRSAPQKLWEKLQGWWDLNQEEMPHIVDSAYLKGLMEKNFPTSHKELKEAQRFWQLWWEKNKKPLESFFTNTYLQEIKKVEKNNEQRLEVLPSKSTGTLPSPQQKSWKKLQKTWKKVWEKAQKNDPPTLANELEEAILRMRMSHLLETLQCLNRAAMIQAFQKRRSPLSKKLSAKLKNIEDLAQKITPDTHSLYQYFLALLIQGILKEIQKQPKDALVIIEEQIALEGLPQDWWFLIFYYRDQLLSRLHYRKKNWRKAFLHGYYSVDMFQNILILRHMQLLMNADQNMMEPVYLPYIGNDLYYVYKLNRKILESWKQAKEGRKKKERRKTLS